MQAFESDACQDAIKIAQFLGAPSRPLTAVRAYKLVAEDVLKVLAESGFIREGDDGWYRSTIQEQLSD